VSAHRPLSAFRPWEINDILKAFVIIIIIIITFIYRSRTEQKMQKLNGVNKRMEGYQRIYSSLKWPPMLIKQNYLT